MVTRYPMNGSCRVKPVLTISSTRRAIQFALTVESLYEFCRNDHGTWPEERCVPLKVMKGWFLHSSVKRGVQCGPRTCNIVPQCEVYEDRSEPYSTASSVALLAHEQGSLLSYTCDGPFLEIDQSFTRLSRLSLD
jgi:hypothetical protein